MVINVKFLEQWLNEPRIKQSSDQWDNGVTYVLENLIALAKHQHPKYKSLKSFIKYEVYQTNESIPEPSIPSSTQAG